MFGSIFGPIFGSNLGQTVDSEGPKPAKNNIAKSLIFFEALLLQDISKCLMDSLLYTQCTEVHFQELV